MQLLLTFEISVSLLLFLFQLFLFSGRQAGRHRKYARAFSTGNMHVRL